MLPKILLSRLILITALVLFGAAGFGAATNGGILAQDGNAPADLPVVSPTETPTPIPIIPTVTSTPVPTVQPTTEPTAIPTVTLPLVVTQNEPSQITAGVVSTISITGANFTSSTIVRLVGYGYLQTTFVNSTALTASVPTSIPAGTYTVEVSDTERGTVSAPTLLTVVSASVVATATPIATTVPGQPSLIVSSFMATPAAVYPGGSAQLTFQVVNVGSRTAEGVVVLLGTGSFIPANGQASVTLPDLSPTSAYTVSLAVTASSTAQEGPSSITVMMSSRDFSGQTYNDQATLSINVLAEPDDEPQVVLSSFLVTPKTASPGDAVTVQAVLTNTGSGTASQVLLQLDSANSPLIAGTQGATFAIGDIAPGAGVPVQMPLVVADDAKSGVQSQSFTISYLQDGTTRQTTASISLEIETVVEQTPLLLLQSYSDGQEGSIEPGQQFKFEFTLQNAGGADASEVLLTFNPSQTSSGDSSSSATTSTSTSSTPNFAPLGSGSSIYIGDLSAGQSLPLSHDFIVSNSLDSGIYSLPMSLQYQLDDGTTSTQSLSASLIVIVAPRLRVTQTEALDDPLTAGESYTLSLKISNLGASEVALTAMRITGENVTITDGAEVLLDPLQSDDSDTESVTFDADDAGDYTISVELDYLDDLNQTQTDITTFTGAVTQTISINIPRPTGMVLNTPGTAQQTEENLLGRSLLGFLGLGG